MRSRLRVIAGTLRGSHLDAPPDSTTRPITDHAKEALFNMLGHRFGTLGELPPFEALDLFAGSGSLGIEALARGVRRCVFVERDRRAARILRENLERTRLLDRSAVLCENAWAMRLPSAEQPSATAAAPDEPGATNEPAGFGLVFVDPPYRDAINALLVADLLDRVAARLGPGGLVAFRHGPVGAPPEETAAGLACLDHRNFKQMHVRLYGRIARQGGPAGVP
jgi:16S rRNA (guanine(966)-N(2))-methyltransferase RsmD